MYDPAGNDINLGDFACFDDQVCNVVMNFYEDGNYNHSRRGVIMTDCFHLQKLCAVQSAMLIALIFDHVG